MPSNQTYKQGRDPATTSRMMAAVHSKNSKAELALRSELHRRGARYRLHASDVVGHPDLVVRKARLAVFVDGDFWHGNSWRLRGLPSLEAQFPNRAEWWTAKIRRNIQRDQDVTRELETAGWRVIRIWESDVLPNPAAAAEIVLAALRQASSSP